MERVGLIAAMPSEGNALLKCVKGWKRTMVGRFHGYQFQLMDRDCLLVTSGMGINRAADATRAIMAMSHPQLLVSFGIAGTVTVDLNIGDVVVSRKNYILKNSQPVQLKSLAWLSEAAWNAVKEDIHSNGARLLEGTTITTRGSQVVEQLLVKLPNPILEMETAGIAQVAVEKGIPLLSIRSISDGPKSPIPIDLAEVMDDKYNIRIDRLLKMVLLHPKIIFNSWQIMQNSKMATHNAAKALVALLTQSSPVFSHEDY